MYKVLIVYDVSSKDTEGHTYGWAYWRRATALQKYAPADFHVDISAYRDVVWRRCGGYHLIFNLEYASPSRRRVKGHSPRPDVPLVVSFNSDSRRKPELWDRATREADFIVCNNVDAFEGYGRKLGTCAISNGTDMDVFRPHVPITDRPHRLLWTGSSGKGKGWSTVLQPLERLARDAGFETSFRTIDEMSQKVVYPTDRQVDWYNSGSYVVCASESEGTPNFLTEAVACGCVAVSVPVGNILEWGIQGRNCVLVGRSAEAFMQGLVYAKEHRSELSAAGLATFRGEPVTTAPQRVWGYGGENGRAQYFYQLFRRIIENGPHTVNPFSYAEIDWREI